MTIQDQQTFRFKRSLISRVYLSVFIGILGLFFYLLWKNDIVLGQLVTGILICIGLYLLLFNKTIVIDTIDRSITVLIDLLGVVISRTVSYIPQGAIVQYKDEYNIHQSGDICWLSMDIREDRGPSLLPLNVQKKLREHSSYNRKMLLDLANTLSSSMNLSLQDLRSTRYRD